MWVESLGLGEHVGALRENNVDGAVLLQLTPQMLVEDLKVQAPLSCLSLHSNLPPHKCDTCIAPLFPLLMPQMSKLGHRERLLAEIDRLRRITCRVAPAAPPPRPGASRPLRPGSAPLLGRSTNKPPPPVFSWPVFSPRMPAP